MQKTTLAQIWVLALIIMVALASLGLVYGFWSEQLHVGGEITTGTVAAAIGATHTESDDPLGVADCRIDVRKTETDGDTVHLILSNAYQGYACTGQFKVANHGTIPLKIGAISTDAATPSDLFDLESGGGCVGQRVDPGAESNDWCWMKVSIKEGAAEGQESFAATFTVEQWMP